MQKSKVLHQTEAKIRQQDRPLAGIGRNGQDHGYG